MVKNILTVALACTLAASADPVQAPTATPQSLQQDAKPPKKEKDKNQKPKADPSKVDNTKDLKPKPPVKDPKPPIKNQPNGHKAGHDTDAHGKAHPAKKPHPPKGMPTEAQLEEAKKQQEALAIINALAAEKQKHETNDLRGEIARLKLEKELLTEKIALAATKQNANYADTIAKYEADMEKLSREANLAKVEAELLTHKLKSLQTNSALKTTSLMAEVSAIEAAQTRDNYANSKPQYLENPLKKDGTLVVSDRRIPFNGPVTSALADRVTDRINYFNNKDPKKPIFIVIDDSPGGSVMAGYRILKAMEGSDAPVYVVVKSFAASMAATITTLAEKSFVYPNAIILHHQISQSFMFASMNLTEQKENFEDLKKWWARLADPIAEKMGITSDEFIEMMYQKTVSGDWTEFGDDAVKLKWADHVVSRVHETALVKNPDAKTPAAAAPSQSAALENGLIPAFDDEGNPYMILPRRNPKDVYLMHNPDGFYRFK